LIIILNELNLLPWSHESTPIIVCFKIINFLYWIGPPSIAMGKFFKLTSFDGNRIKVVDIQCSLGFNLHLNMTCNQQNCHLHFWLNVSSCKNRKTYIFIYSLSLHMWKRKLQPHMDICHLNSQLKNEGK